MKRFLTFLLIFAITLSISFSGSKYFNFVTPIQAANINWISDPNLLQGLPSVFSNRTPRPRLLDLDNDNDLDLILGYDSGTNKDLLAYRNNGDSSAPSFVADQSLVAGIPSPIPSSQANPAFGDLDNDGDYDCILRTSVLLAYRNDGTPENPSFVEDDSLITGLDDSTINYIAGLELVDIDDDGDLDIIAGREVSGDYMMGYRNNGNASAPDFSYDPSLAQGLTDLSSFGTFNYYPTLWDLDNDSDLDILVGENYPFLYTYLNEGSTQVPNFNHFDTKSYPGNLANISPTLGDLDGDSDPEMLIGYSGPTNLEAFDFEFLSQIKNLSGDLNVLNSNQENIEEPLGSYGIIGNGTPSEVYLEKFTGEILASIELTLDKQDSDWGSVSGDLDIENGKAVINGLETVTGGAPTHSLYIPIPEGKYAKCAYICPGSDIDSLEEVSQGCTDGGEVCIDQNPVNLGGDSITVTKETIDSQPYLIANGLTGSGGYVIASSFDLKDTMSRLEINQDSDHTIEFGSINGLTEVGDSIEIQFDPDTSDFDLSSVTIADIDLEDDGTDLTLAATADATHWGVDINTTTDTITFTHPTDGTFEDIDPNSILVAKIGTVADGGVNQITNPSTVGDYEIAFTNTYTAGTGGTETGEVEIPIVDDDTVNVTGYIDTVMSFDIDTATTDVNCDAAGGASPCNSHSGATDGAGYVVDLGELTLTNVNKSGDSVTHADGLTGNINYIWFDLETNASSGAVVTVVSANEGLYKDASNIIPSVATGSEQQILAASGLYGLNHRSGFTNSAAIGSMLVDTDCDASTGDNYYCDVADGGTPISIFDSNSLPIDDGRMQFSVGASPDSADGTGTYTDQLTFVASSTF